MSDIVITKHAVDRVDERLYIRYFRDFRYGEDKRQWLSRIAREALVKGVSYSTENKNITAYWYRDIIFIFQNYNKKDYLLTVYPGKRPKSKWRANIVKEFLK